MMERLSSAQEKGRDLKRSPIRTYASSRSALRRELRGGRVATEQLDDIGAGETSSAWSEKTPGKDHKTTGTCASGFEEPLEAGKNQRAARTELAWADGGFFPSKPSQEESLIAAPRQRNREKIPPDPLYWFRVWERRARVDGGSSRRVQRDRHAAT